MHMSEWVSIKLYGVQIMFSASVHLIPITAVYCLYFNARL